MTLSLDCIDVPESRPMVVVGGDKHFILKFESVSTMTHRPPRKPTHTQNLFGTIVHVLLKLQTSKFKFKYFGRDERTNDLQKAI